MSFGFFVTKKTKLMLANYFGSTYLGGNRF
jgi:hypothetical protein